MVTFNYNTGGVSADVQFGINGGRLVWNTDHFESTSDGITLAQHRVPTIPVGVNDAASKDYVDGLPKPYHMFMFKPLAANGGETIVVYTFLQTVTFQNDFNTSVGSVQNNPTATYTCDIDRNGVVIGAAAVSATGVVTFSTLGGVDEVFNVNDTIGITAPAATDATLDGLSLTLAGTR